MPVWSHVYNLRKMSQQFWILTLLNNAKEGPHAHVVSRTFSCSWAMVGTPMAQVWNKNYWGSSRKYMLSIVENYPRCNVAAIIHLLEYPTWRDKAGVVSRGRLLSSPSGLTNHRVHDPRAGALPSASVSPCVQWEPWEYTDLFAAGSQNHLGAEDRSFPAPQAPKLCLWPWAPVDPTELGHPNTQVPGNQGWWLLWLRESEAHQVLEGPALWLLCFLLRDLTGALPLGRANGWYKP